MLATEIESGATAPELLAFMAGRPAFYAVDGDRASYTNEDTGVVISVAIEPTGRTTVSAPLLRPSFWGVELGRVVDRLASVGGRDPHGAGDRAAAEWERQNRTAWSLDAVDPESIVADRVVGTWWSWNVHLIDNRPLYPDLFVPKAQIGRFGDEWLTFSVWTDLGDVLLPPVDHVLVLSAGLVSQGVASGLVPLTRAQVEDLYGEIGPDGRAVTGARSDPRAVGPLQSIPPLEGRVTAARPEDLVERRYVASVP